MKPAVSVVLAVYNQDRYLKKCLESLAKQKDIDFEVILVDDGSFAQIKNSVRQPACRRGGPADKYFRISHSGTAKARNFGAGKARGKILVFVDGDMKFESDFLEKLTKPIREKKARGTFSTQEYVANWDNVWARCWNWENNLPFKKRIDPERVDMAKDFRSILKTEFDKVGGFDDIGYTDTWTLSEKLGYKPRPVGNAVYYHYNPASLLEANRQAIWIGGRKRRFGILGKLGALLRATLPFSIFLGMVKSLLHLEFRFLIFKIVYDLGIFTGVIASFFRGDRR